MHPTLVIMSQKHTSMNTDVPTDETTDPKHRVVVAEIMSQKHTSMNTDVPTDGTTDPKHRVVVAEIMAQKHTSMNTDVPTDGTTDREHRVVVAEMYVQSDQPLEVEQTIKNTDQGIVVERDLKSNQTSALSKVTKKKNEITRHISNDMNLDVVKVNLDEYNQLLADYQDCHDEYIQTITDETVIDKETVRYDNHVLSITHFRNLVQDWISSAERRLTDGMDEALSHTSKHSRLSRSSQSSRHGSGSSHSSRSGISERTKAKARLAELMAEKSMLQQKTALKAQEQELLLNIKIAKVQAREHVLAEVELECNELHVSHDVRTGDIRVDNDKMHVDNNVTTGEMHVHESQRNVPVVVGSVISEESSTPSIATYVHSIMGGNHTQVHTSKNVATGPTCGTRCNTNM